jgi:hypothetical protein
MQEGADFALSCFELAAGQCLLSQDVPSIAAYCRRLLECQASHATTTRHVEGEDHTRLRWPCVTQPAYHMDAELAQCK